MTTYWERWSALVLLAELMAPGDHGSIVAAPRPAWMGAAACSRAGTADWFPGKGHAPTTARAVCQSCPCPEFAPKGHLGLRRSFRCSAS